MVPKVAFTDTSALLVLNRATYLITKYDSLTGFTMKTTHVEKVAAESCPKVVALMQTKTRAQTLVPVTVSSSNVLSFHGTFGTMCAWQNQISGLEQVKMISTGRNHALIVLVDGRVLSFGHTGSGALGHGDRQSRNRPTEIQALRDVDMSHAAAGFDHSLFVSIDGEAWTCGQGTYGQLGLGSTDEALTPQYIRQLPAGQVVHCTAAVQTSCFLLSDGSAWSCGNGRTGILGHGHKRDVLVPQRISGHCPNMSGFVQCSFGMTHGLFLTFDCIASAWWGIKDVCSPIRASVVGVGSNKNGQLGHFSEDVVLRPKELRLPFGSIPVAIAASTNASLIVLRGGSFLVIAQREIQTCSLTELNEKMLACQQSACATCW
jgi:alpha-tubulin suppressor-like RCC1 family protein